MVAHRQAGQPDCSSGSSLISAPGETNRHVSVFVTGIVQGVGFRPFVFRLATELKLGGWVANGSDGVEIELNGPSSNIQEFLKRLTPDRPPLAAINSVTMTELAGVPLSIYTPHGFHIRTSQISDGPNALVPPDIAICHDCLREMTDPSNRRFGHPLINCTNCGPRFTIVQGVPYDRASTTMSSFDMCHLCQAEYTDPSDRRFHAEPISCCGCGPRLTFVSQPLTIEQAINGDAQAISACVKALRAGLIVAIKGISGYHLAVDATNENAVQRLRHRKHRDEKPFAVLGKDLAALDRFVALGNESRAALLSTAAPIVIATKRQVNPSYAIAEGVAPSNMSLGVMLPGTGLQYLLAQAMGRLLVMTSGNQVSEPIVYRDEEAFRRLCDIADAFLFHDREIYRSADDSVIRASARGDSTIRRARGFAPTSFRSDHHNSAPVLGVGAELKSTVCLSRGMEAVMSPHLGDLEDIDVFRCFTTAISDLESMLGVNPALVVHDLHPEYLSTKWAIDQDFEVLAVQHHHAHVASCLAEHNLNQPVVGLAFDGHGYGPDATLWGGECLVADLHGFRRIGALEPIGLPGGATAIREPWRMAAAFLTRAYDGDVPEVIGVRRRNESKWEDVALLSTLPMTIKTSSMGRLFDAIASILDLRDRSSFEGQAAMQLEQAALRIARYTVQPELLAPIEIHTNQSLIQLQPDSFLRSLVEQQRRGVETGELAWGAHRAIADAAASLAATTCELSGLTTVVLSGGVFQNVLLTELVSKSLTDRGLRVLTHSLVPCNDGGISLGQVAIGRASLSQR